MLNLFRGNYLSILIIAILAIIILQSCYNKKADLIIPNNNCDTSVVISYRNDISNILQQNCFRCHATDKYASMGGNHQLDSFLPLQQMVMNGKLLLAINHLPGAVPMPYDGGKLSDCDIMKITAWVNRGAPNN